MKTTFKIGLTVLLIIAKTSLFAQKTDKKVITFSVERAINAPADKVWKVVGEDFGAIANSHPKIVSSNYNQGHIIGGENASRTCNFNEKGTKYLQETQVDFDAKNYTFKVLINNTSGIPLNSEYSYGIYKVIPIDSDSSKLVMTMGLRTKPAFLGSIAKGQFKRDIANYLLAVEHYVLTGENVNKENFKEIKKKYEK
ncbi:SRPBCC family protein [Aquimarina sp. 2201CG5-10]|uniref:SRPBCC family protein n=1 Tax=Aquimarina callyspongiae TaxID=3098150 RepID=UPI002AB52032|nr:SRPBCC family protein [Aquimarina sp. 2201CG5-10]MDY8137346.1 SRPBCC family protein [Aquimarina sp. 2201CG5-10]